MASSSGVSKSPGVTPCVGVWIETATGLVTVNQGGVTPCVGVWIETIFKKSDTIISLSHPAWVCGLKLKKEGRWLLSCRVTPCVGVWIETAPPSMLYFNVPSHPAWVCGLKQ